MDLVALRSFENYNVKRFWSHMNPDEEDIREVM